MDSSSLTALESLAATLGLFLPDFLRLFLLDSFLGLVPDDDAWMGSPCVTRGELGSPSEESLNECVKVVAGVESVSGGGATFMSSFSGISRNRIGRVCFLHFTLEEAFAPDCALESMAANSRRRLLPVVSNSYEKLESVSFRRFKIVSKVVNFGLKSLNPKLFQYVAARRRYKQRKTASTMRSVA